MHNLVVSALQKGRVNGNHRLGAFAGHACSQRDGVLLGNSDVKIAVGVLLAEGNQVRAFLHRRRDTDQAGILCGHVTQPLAENVRKFGLAGAAGGCGLGFQFGDRVVANGIGFRR